MKDNELLYKITNNKLLLFIVPNLVYMSNLLYYYNSNFEGMLEVLFSEVIIISLVFFLITALLYVVLSKVLKDKQKIFLILTFISFFYCLNLSLIYFLLFIVFVLILILEFKKFINFKLDSIVCILVFIISFLFAYNFITAGVNVSYMIIKSKSFDNDIEIKVEEDAVTPNIYWIHCDGMMGIEAMQKYFNYNDNYLINYFNDNSYYLNEEATLVAGHKTQKALVALFNPYYYDNFFKDYLYELEDKYIDNKKKLSFVVDYYELEEKRLNNELFEALDKKDYTTVAISEFNPYASFYTDYYYDYYYYGTDIRHIYDNNNELRKLNNNSELRKLNNNSELSLLSYIRFVHMKPLLNRTIFYDITGNLNYLNYDVVDYNNFDSSDYKYIDKSMEDNNYWLSKALLKGLDNTMAIEDNKFVFVDFRANHDPFTFDRNGNVIDAYYQYSTEHYLGNYIYSSKLLTDMLEFIKDNDEEAIIIVQSDHGLHTVEDEVMLDYFNTDMEGVQEIRNSVISAYYVPEKYQNGDEEYLDNPLNVSRYIINNYVGNNYDYID